MTDDDLRLLASLRSLQELSLGETRITDAGLVHLRGLGGLRRLNLRGTAVTNADVAELRKALPNCQITR